MTSGFFPVEGTLLSEMEILPGVPTQLLALDDFLPWQGLPESVITIIEGTQSGRLARKIVTHQTHFQKAAWVHTLRNRPFFHESQWCFRIQVPEEADMLEVVAELLREKSLTTIFVQLNQPLSRAQATELHAMVSKARVALVLICKQAHMFPPEKAMLIIDAEEDYLNVRKAPQRAVPMWIPFEMLDMISGSVERSLLTSWDALDNVNG